MPIYEKDNRLIHHIHIPKCGGKSIQKLLERNGWKRKDLIVPVHLQHEVKKSFKNSEGLKTSHEHRNIWNSWNLDVEFQFALVRNPYDRLKSRMRQTAYHYDDENFISMTEVFMFLEWIFNQKAGDSGMMDNHFRPQVDFIGPKTHVYKIEEDIESLVYDLSLRDIIVKDSLLEKVNAKKEIVDIEIPWNSESLKHLHKKFCNLYSQDFNLFDYKKLAI